MLTKEEETSPGKKDVLYDLIIAGGGPGGMTASVYASRKQMKALLISKDLGGQVLLTSEVENYMGYKYITGEALMAKFKEQVSHFPLDQEIGEEVKSISRDGDDFDVLTTGGGHFKSRSVIIATGKRSRPLGVRGEKELIGRGVSYCSVCDGPFFQGKDVAVVGGGNSGFQAAIDLVKIASKIYLIDVASTWRADLVLVENAEGSDKIEFFPSFGIGEIHGEKEVSGITIERLDSGEKRKLPVQAVFVEIGLIPNSRCADGLTKLNSAKEIVVDCNNQTNVAGIFAAGDVTNVREKQIIIAAGEGAKATLAAYEYLLRLG